MASQRRRAEPPAVSDGRRPPPVTPIVNRWNEERAAKWQAPGWGLPEAAGAFRFSGTQAGTVRRLLPGTAIPLLLSVGLSRFERVHFALQRLDLAPQRFPFRGLPHALRHERVPLGGDLALEPLHAGGRRSKIGPRLAEVGPVRARLTARDVAVDRGPALRFHHRLKFGGVRLAARLMLI